MAVATAVALAADEVEDVIWRAAAEFAQQRSAFSRSRPRSSATESTSIRQPGFVLRIEHQFAFVTNAI